MSTAFTVATSATQLNCIILLPLDGSNPDSSQLNRKPMGAELSKPLTSNVLKSFKLPEQNRRRLWHWMRMPLTFKCPMCDQWVYKFMCFAGYVQVVLLQSSISIYLYNFIYRYMPLSLCILSCIYDEAQVSQNLSVSASSAGGHGLYLGILQELQGLCRACEGLRLSGQHNMSQHTSTHRYTSQLKESELPALCQSPKALGVHFPTLYTWGFWSQRWYAQ